MSRDAALSELLDDLRHDLAKYLRLPFRLLPGDVEPEVVREALDRALLRTQQNTAGTRSAYDIYAELRGRLGPLASGSPRLAALDAAVEKALSWEGPLRGGGPLDRSAIERDFEALSKAIDVWIDEVRGG